MMSRKTRMLSVEQLERRELMAGNVSASMNGDTLEITGDRFNNQIQIERVDADQIRVVVQDATRLNNDSSQDTLVFSRPNNLSIDMGAGNDRVALKNFQLNGNLQIDTAYDNDAVSLTDMVIRGNLDIKTDRGTRAGTSDVLSWQDVQVGGAANVELGRGADIFVLQGFNHVGDDFELDTAGYTRGRGQTGRPVRDSATDIVRVIPPYTRSVQFAALDVDGDFSLKLSNGDDQLSLQKTHARHLSVSAFAGNDDIRLREARIGGDLTIQGHSGDDFIKVYDNTRVGDDISIRGDAGEDRLLVYDTTADDISVVSGSERDIVIFNGVQARDRFFADLGAGNDTLYVSWSGAGRWDFRGGSGRDTYSEYANWWMGPLNTRVSGF